MGFGSLFGAVFRRGGCDFDGGSVDIPAADDEDARGEGCELTIGSIASRKEAASKFKVLTGTQPRCEIDVSFGDTKSVTFSPSFGSVRFDDGRTAEAGGERAGDEEKERGAETRAIESANRDSDGGGDGNFDKGRGSAADDGKGTRCRSSRVRKDDALDRYIRREGMETALVYCSKQKNYLPYNIWHW